MQNYPHKYAFTLLINDDLRLDLMCWAVELIYSTFNFLGLSIYNTKPYYKAISLLCLDTKN